jgi:hypothetical protein
MRLGPPELHICKALAAKLKTLLGYEFFGYDQLPPAQTFAERLIVTGKLMGLSQKRLALSIVIGRGPLKSWEAQRHRPTLLVRGGLFNVVDDERLDRGSG